MNVYLLAIPLLAASVSVPPAAKDLTRIRVEWANDLHSKKVEEIVGLYANDAVFLDPSGERFTGRPAIRDLMKKVTEAFTSNITLRSITVEVSGKLAYDSGDYQETMVPTNGTPALQLRGTYLTVFRHEPDGAWRIIQQMWAAAK